MPKHLCQSRKKKKKDATSGRRRQRASSRSTKLWRRITRYQKFKTLIAVLYTELWCQCLRAHQHSQHFLCLSLHNYTSWSCILSPPDHLFPAANLLNVPASSSTSSPYRVNLGIDIIFSLFTSLCSSHHSLLLNLSPSLWNTHTHIQCDRLKKQQNRCPYKFVCVMNVYQFYHIKQNLMCRL